MKNNKGKNITITLLVIIIIILIGIIALMYTGVITNNNNNNDNSISNEVEKDDDAVESKKLDETEALIIGKELYDKANEIYETWVLLPYCGVARNDISEQKSYDLGGDSGIGTGQYYKTVFKDLDDLKKYLSKWLAEDVIENKITETAVTDLNLLKNLEYAYTKYVIKDNNLYCRIDTGKGWLTTYANYYDISIDVLENDKITYNIKSYYVDNMEAECRSSGYVSVNSCDESEISTKDTKFVIEKNAADNWIVSEFTLHQ